MFRKITHILFAFLLLISTIGFSVSKHYCGPSLVSVSIYSEAESCCGDKESSECCRNETEFYKFDKDFTNPVIVENNQITELDILFLSASIYLMNQEVIIETDILNFAESPPPPNLHNKLSLFQTYLI